MSTCVHARVPGIPEVGRYHRPLSSNPKLGLKVSYPYTKFGVNMSKQTKVIERKLQDKYYVVYCFQMSHAHAADLDDTTFNAKWDMLAKVSRVWES